MCNILLFVCVFSGITWSFAVSQVKFSVSQREDNYVFCEQTQENPAKALILENEDMTLSIDYGTYNNYFQCVGNNNPSYVFVKNPTKSQRTSVISVKATPQMSGLWVCTIYTNKDVDVGIQPVVDVQIEKVKGKFTELRCFVDVHVRLLETPQTVLVNNIKLPTKRMDYTEEEFDHSAMYYYLDGDIVTVQCLPGSNALKDTNNLSPIEFKYDYAENLDNMFKEQLEENRSKLYGFRTKLQARHNNSIMICKYHGKDDNTTIKVTFVMRTIHDNVGFITINELVARPFQDKDELNSEINYLSVDGENVVVVCTSNIYYLRTAEEEENCENGGSTFTKSLTTPFEYNCYLCSKNIGVYSIKVVTNKLDSNFKEIKRLDVDLPGDNILMELFKYDGDERDSWIYYEFEEGEQVDLKCIYTRVSKVNGVMEVVYYLNNKEFKPSESLTLTSGHENYVFECVLREIMDPRNSRPVITKRIKVLFRKRPLTTTTTAMTTTTSSTTLLIEQKITEAPQLNITAEPVSLLDGFEIPIWAIAAIAVLTCVVLSCVITAICKMRKSSQTRESGANNYENLQNQNSQTTIPPYPEQWSRREEQNYDVPVDIRNESNIYSEPVKGPDDPYATPIPKSQRPPKGYQDNPAFTYAELNIPGRGKNPRSNYEDPQYSSVKELYTQVVPKDMRPKNKNDYGNVFPDSRYVNSENAEYVEPTYCQPHKK